jgi:predicted transglutaminase-like cysteine proteinase
MFIKKRGQGSHFPFIISQVGLWALMPLSAQAFTPAMQESNVTQPPMGYQEFCLKHPSYCEISSVNMGPAEYSKSLMRTLVSINSEVNKTVRPITDMEYYGQMELWSLPDDYGDCEDYVLLKRQKLLEKGFHDSQLLISVVYDEIGDGHAVLTVRTDQGDFILDNKTDKIKRWDQTPYQFVKRQSAFRLGEWALIHHEPDEKPANANIRTGEN